jgi:hypothetical protein
MTRDERDALRKRNGYKETRLDHESLEHAYADALARGLYDHHGPWSSAPLPPSDALEMLEYLEANGSAEQVEAFRAAYFGE